MNGESNLLKPFLLPAVQRLPSTKASMGPIVPAMSQIPSTCRLPPIALAPFEATNKEPPLSGEIQSSIIATLPIVARPIVYHSITCSLPPPQLPLFSKVKGM